MVADTDPQKWQRVNQAIRVRALANSAAELIGKGCRGHEQIEALLRAMQDFKDLPSIKDAAEQPENSKLFTEYPGMIGPNRCGCGASLPGDDDVCGSCGWNHRNRYNVFSGATPWFDQNLP